MSLIEPIEAEFQSQKFKLVFDVRAQRRAEYKLAELRGEKRQSVLGLVQESARVGEIPPGDVTTVVLWASMLKHEPEMTFEQVEDLLDNPLEAGSYILLLFKGMFTDEIRKAFASLRVEEPDDPLAPQTGNGSGVSPESSSDSAKTSSGA